jgi:GNAT superfamily N-acetyltransferase
MANTRELSPQLLDRATHPLPGRELRLVAVTGDGEVETMVAAASYAAIGDCDCEFAVAVADEWQRLGLARRLLELLMSSARADRFERMDGYVLASNTSMLSLARRLGFAPVKYPEDPTVRLIRRDLTAPLPGRKER